MVAQKSLFIKFQLGWDIKLFLSRRGRMKNAFKVFLVLLSINIIGCSIPQGEVQETGEVVFSIAPFAPWVELNKQVADSGKGATSKAWMVASTVKFEFYQSTTIVKTETWTADAIFSTGAQTLARTINYVPVGSYTKVVVSIFNNAVSTSTPVVRGESGSFTITANASTPITVTCFPVSYVDLADGAWSSTYTLAYHAEKWFRVNSDYGTTRFYVNTISGDMDIYVFKPDGTYLGSHTGTDATNTVDLSTPSNPYWVCMFAYAAGSGKVQFR